MTDRYLIDWCFVIYDYRHKFSKENTVKYGESLGLHCLFFHYFLMLNEPKNWNRKNPFDSTCS
jgi:hypothetical protein